MTPTESQGICALSTALPLVITLMQFYLPIVQTSLKAL
jgi:hypothetical protein